MAPRRILVRAPNWVGDVVMATPGFRALRAGFPEARIALQIRAGLAPLLAGAPWFDEVLPVTSHRRGARALLGEGLRLRRQTHFDLGICLPDSFASALLMRAAGVREIIGYRRGGRGLLLTRPVPRRRGADGGSWVARERHVLGLLDPLGCERRGTHLELFVTPDEESATSDLLGAQDIEPGAPLVALAPGSAYGPSKRWPAESFARAADALARAGARVVVVGSPQEALLARRVTEAMREPAANLVPHLDLGTLKGVIRRSRVLLCNDAGARHVAVAFGVPCVVLMGPTSLEKTGFNLERVRVLVEDVPCRPCYRRICPIDQRCMTRIDPQRVVAAAVPALSGETAAGRRGGEATAGAAIAQEPAP